jgi:hypothetical protein
VSGSAVHRHLRGVERPDLRLLVGCSGQDDSQLPAGKCYHGLEEFPGLNHAGTNKDSEGRPDFPAAQRLALESTKKIIERLLDGDGVKDNLKATAALMGVTTLAFVVDDTGSMGEDIAGVQRAVRTIVNTAGPSRRTAAGQQLWSCERRGKQLRLAAARREGAGDGRVYHLFLQANDGRGGSCRATVRVCVPHDQDTLTCVDQGPQFDSLAACR